MNFRFCPHNVIHLWLPALLLGVCYAALHHMALHMLPPPNALPIMGYANALAITVLFSKPRKQWPYYLASCVVLESLAFLILHHEHVPNMHVELLLLPGNLLHIVLATFLIQRQCGNAQQIITRVGELLKALMIGAVISPILPAMLSAALIFKQIPLDFTDIWLLNYDGILSGTAVFLPFGLMALGQGFRPLMKALGNVYVWLAMTLAVFSAVFFPTITPYPYAYIGITLFGVALIGHFAAVAPAIMACSGIAALVMLTDHNITTAVHSSTLASTVILEHHLPLVLTLLPPVLFGVSLTHLKRYAKALENSKKHFRDTYHHTPIMMFSMDANLRIVSVSDLFADRMNMSREDLIGRRISEYMTAESNARLFSEVMTKLKNQSRIDNVSLCLITPSHDSIDVLFSAVYEFDDNDRVQVLAVLTDISEQRRLARALANEKELMEITLQSIGDGVVTTDAGGRIHYLNPVAERLLGTRVSRVKGKAFSSVFHLFEEANGVPINPVAQCLASGEASTAPRHARLHSLDENHEYGIRFVVSTLRAREGEGDILGTVTVFQDFTESRQLTQRMTYLAHHDTLTTLPNRTLFQERLEHHCSQSDTQFSVVFVDLDHFKNVNDSLGHDVGDELLKVVSDRLLSALRANDAVFRLGGDEFVLILTGTCECEHISHITERIIKVLSTPFNLNGHELQVSASLGIARYPADGKTPETLMKHADTAMYRAKRDGRNRFSFFSPDDDLAALTRLSVENDLRRDLGKGRFELHYQPIIDSSSLRVRSLEVLVRWHRNGDSTLIYPDQFIAIAEETGLIVPLGEEILQQALEQLALWRQHSRELDNIHIAVNVSARQMARAGFIDRVIELLRASELPNHCLEIEITESTLIQDPDQMLEMLNRLHNLCVQVTIDDFGTGYSSLSYLKRFPVNCVKIDRSFVMELEQDSSNRKLVAAILAMSASLNLQSVAEGVENQEQAIMLQQMGCPSLQGYYFSRPVKAADVPATVERINNMNILPSDQPGNKQEPTA